MVKTSFARTKPLDQRRSQSSGQPHRDSVLVIGGAHVTVAYEYHGNLVLLEERKGGVRVSDGDWSVLVHGMGRDWVVREPFVHPDEDSPLRRARSLEIFFQPS